MSQRDKKLLIYLGALLILAAAYILVGRPYIDKLDALNDEKMALRSELNEKQQLLARQGEFIAGIEAANNEMQTIIDMFPEDNTDEKSIMFISNAEKEIPAWFAQIKFADVTEDAVSATSASDQEAAAEAEAVASAEGEETTATEGEAAEGTEASSGVGDMIGRDTEIGLTFKVKYDGFKKWLAYLRDYEDRMVIKEMEVTYDDFGDLVTGNMTLSQYALLGPGRELPETVTDVEDVGKSNVFAEEGYSRTILDLIGELANDLIDAIVGGLNGSATEEEEKYFINVTTQTDNTNAKTIGRAKDPSGTTYLTSDKNEKESVEFSLRGADGRYYGEYEMGGFKVTDDDFKTDITGHVVLRIISSTRKDSDDQSAITLHLRNTSDIPLVVYIKDDDPENPRVEIADKEGDITINE